MSPNNSDAYKDALRQATKDNLRDSPVVLTIVCATCKRPRAKVHNTPSGLVLRSDRLTMEGTDIEKDLRNLRDGKPLRYPEVTPLVAKSLGAVPSGSAEANRNRLDYLIERLDPTESVDVFCPGKCGTTAVNVSVVISASRNPATRTITH